MRELEYAFPSAAACISRLHMRSKGLAGICRHIPILPNSGIETARVCTSGRSLRMEINPEFWERLSEHDRTLILAHEAFHIALGHLGRGRGYPQQMMNVAADAITNDWLIHELDLDLSPQLLEQVITMETVGLENGSALSMEHVMSQMKFETCVQMLSMSTWASEHAFIGEGLADEQIRGVVRRLTPAEIQDIGWSPYAVEVQKDELQHVSMHAAAEIMRLLAVGRHGRRDCQQHTWIREPRRMSDGLLIPHADEVKNASGCHVRFYLDSSGSMNGFEDMLLGCTEELKRNDISVSKFWFDTQVHPCEKRFMSGGGGTDFRCIASHAASSPRFDMAVVITDGYAPRAEVQNASKWLWLITEDGSHHAVGHMRWKPISWAFRKRKASK